MPDLRKIDDERSKQHWEFVEANAHQVESWPAWKQAAVMSPTASVVVCYDDSRDDKEPESYLPLAGD